jgi:hypothetical protein
MRIKTNPTINIISGATIASSIPRIARYENLSRNENIRKRCIPHDFDSITKS